MEPGWPRSRIYLLGTVANWALFLLAVYVLAWGSEQERLPAAALWGIVLLATASVAGQFLAAYAPIGRQDEFIRAITAKRIIAATGVTITIAVLWGLAQQSLGAPQIPIWVVYPLFWGLVGIVTPFVRDTRP